MHFHLPKPLHGWREFAGEVGVIVLGVLIALGAQQIVQDIQTRADEKAFRDTIDHEIGLNLFVYEVRALQFKCTAKKIDELHEWLDKARSGAAVPAIHASDPATLSPNRSAWDTRDAGVFNHLPAEIRQNYAEFYDELANNSVIIQTEAQDWGRLWPYSEPGPISLADRRTIRTAIGKVASSNAVLEANFVVARRIAADLGVKMAEPDNFPHQYLTQIQQCRSVFTPPEQWGANHKLTDLFTHHG